MNRAVRNASFLDSSGGEAGLITPSLTCRTVYPFRGRRSMLTCTFPMQPGTPARRSRSLSVLAALFISAYFFLFTYDSLNAYFTFDDGMNLVALHHHWEVPLRANIVDALKVFTPAYRPLGALVY